MKKILGIDIDGVIAESDPMFRRYMGEFFNRTFDRKDVTTFNYEDAFGITREQMRGFWNYFTSSGGWDKIPPVKGAAETIDKLRNNFHIVVVTGRPVSLKDVTVSWLKNNNVNYDKLIMTDFRDKFELLSESDLFPEWFIEDHRDFALGLSENGVKVLLYDYPWNRDIPEKQKNIIRISSWDDIYKILTE